MTEIYINGRKVETIDIAPWDKKITLYFLEKPTRVVVRLQVEENEK